jgi:hypothetical protein
MIGEANPQYYGDVFISGISCLGSPGFKHHYHHHYPFEWPYEISTSLEVCSAIQQRTSKITSEVVKPTYPEPG